MFVSYWLSMISIHASRYVVRGECVHFERGKAAYYYSTIGVVVFTILEWGV